MCSFIPLHLQDRHLQLPLLSSPGADAAASGTTLAAPGPAGPHLWVALPGTGASSPYDQTSAAAQPLISCADHGCLCHNNSILASSHAPLLLLVTPARCTPCCRRAHVQRQLLLRARPPGQVLLLVQRPGHQGLLAQCQHLLQGPRRRAGAVPELPRAADGGGLLQVRACCCCCCCFAWCRLFCLNSGHITACCARAPCCSAALLLCPVPYLCRNTSKLDATDYWIGVYTEKGADSTTEYRGTYAYVDGTPVLQYASEDPYAHWWAARHMAGGADDALPAAPSGQPVMGDAISQAVQRPIPPSSCPPKPAIALLRPQVLQPVLLPPAHRYLWQPAALRALRQGRGRPHVHALLGKLF